MDKSINNNKHENKESEERFVSGLLAKSKRKDAPEISDLIVVFDKLLELSLSFNSNEVYSSHSGSSGSHALNGKAGAGARGSAAGGFDYFYMFFNILLEIPTLSLDSGNRMLHMLMLKKLNGTIYSNTLIQNYCCQNQWITRLLNFMTTVHRDSDVLGEISVTLQILTFFNVTPMELKYFFRLLESANDERPYWWNILVETLEYVFRNRDGPDIYFNFSHSSSGLMVPERDPLNDYTISFWMSCEDFTNITYRPTLYSFFSDDDVGLECTFQLQSLVFSIKTKNNKSPIIKSMFKFQPKKWYYVTVSHEYYLFKKSQLLLYINGKVEERMPVLFPKSDKKFTRCHIGNSGTLSNGFVGRLGSVLMLNAALTPAEVMHLYTLSKDSTLLHEKMPRENSMTGIYDGEMFLENGRRNLKIVFLYHPKATDKALCFEISTGELSNASTIMDGVNVIRTTPPLEQLIYIGGLRMIYPLFYQLGQPVNGMEMTAAEITDTTQFSPVQMSFQSMPVSQAPTPIFPTSSGSGHIGSLLKMLLTLLEHHSGFREQILETHGFQVISFLLKSEPSSVAYWTPEDIDVLGRILSFCSSNPQLWNLSIQHLIMNNFQIWSKTHLLTQISLFESIRQRVQANAHFWRNTVKVSQWFSILKKYYVIDDDVVKRGALDKLKKSRSQIIVIIRETVAPLFNSVETKWLALFLKESTVENQEDITKMLEDIIPPMQNKETWWDDMAQQETLRSRNLLSTQLPLPKHISYLWEIDCTEEIQQLRDALILEEKNIYLLYRHWIKIRKYRNANLSGVVSDLPKGAYLPVVYKLKELGINIPQLNNNNNNNIYPPSSIKGSSNSNTVTSPVLSPFGSPIVMSPLNSPLNLTSNNIPVNGSSTTATTTSTTSTTSTNLQIQLQLQQLPLEPEDTTVVHWKLDKSEGPLRMRRKLKRNYLGSDYKGLSKQNKFGRNRRIVVDIYQSEHDTIYLNQDCGDGLGNIVVIIKTDPPLHPLSTLFKEFELNSSKELISSNSIDIVSNNNNNNNNSNTSTSTSGSYSQSNLTTPKRSSILFNSGISSNEATSHTPLTPALIKSPSKLSLLSLGSPFTSPPQQAPQTPQSSGFTGITSILSTNSNSSSSTNLFNSPPSNSNNSNLPTPITNSEILSPTLVDNVTSNTLNTLTNSFQDFQQEEKILGVYDCRMVSPVGVIAGKFILSTSYLSFEKNIRFDTAGHRIQEPDSGSYRIKNFYYWKIKDLVEIHRARYLLRWNSLEIFINNKSYLLNFQSEPESIQVFNKIVNLHPPNLRVRWSDRPEKILKRMKLTQKWKDREISNFEYLMYLNTIAGRTYNDISQYPIFPQILADYKSECLDLNSEASYRDLKKPIGALNQQRLETLITRSKALMDPEIPPFLYGSHYSSGGIVSYYLVRMEPFTSCHLQLQSGVFDHAQRMFESMEKMWDGVVSPNLTDVKELTPEFFYLPEFITNNEGFQFNFPSSPNGDLILPKWANQSPELFIQKMREALESEYVSMNINHWIDLIFGYKQVGPEAEEANNVFFHLTYEGSAALKKDDPEERRSIESQIKEFGQTPPQLFKKAHPVRKSLQELNRPPKDLFSRFTNLFPSSFSLNSPPPTTSSPSLQYPFKILNNSIPLIHIGSCQDSDVIVLVYRDGVMAVNQFNGTSPSNNLPFTFDIDKTLSTYREKQIDTLFMSESVSCISNCFTITPDGRMLFSCANWDSIFKVCNIQNGKIHRIYRDFHRGMVTCISMGVSGKTIATGSTDTTILVWDDVSTLIKDARTKPVYRLCSHNDTVNCIDINEEWDLIASGSKDKKCLLHTLRTGSYVRTLYHLGSVEMVKISTAAQIVISYCSDHYLYVHSFNGKLLKMLSCDERLYDIKLTGSSTKKGGILGVGDSTQFIVTGGTKGVKVRSLPDLNIVYGIDLTTTIRTIELVSNEKYLMIGLNDGNLIIIPFVKE